MPCASCASAFIDDLAACLPTSTFSRARSSLGYRLPGIPAEVEYYRTSERWSAESLERRATCDPETGASEQFFIPRRRSC